MYKYMRNDPEHEGPPIKATTKFVQKLCPDQALTSPTPPHFLLVTLQNKLGIRKLKS